MEIKTRNNWKQNPNKFFYMGPTIFELWVMETELWVMETQNPNTPIVIILLHTLLTIVIMSLMTINSMAFLPSHFLFFKN